MRTYTPVSPRLGRAHDDPEVLRLAAEYLERWGK